MTHQECKDRHYRKLYDAAPVAPCACGCEATIKTMDHYGRPRRFVSGHNGRKYDDPSQHKREWNHRNRERRLAYKKAYGKRRKVALIQVLGGCCARCGLEYDGNNAALFDVHHTDPSQKRFALNVVGLINKKWEAILEEAGKCELLCSNHHRLEHFGGW